MDGWMDGRIDGWMDGCVEDLSNVMHCNVRERE